MKNELRKTIRRLCDEVGTDSAAASAEPLTEQLTKEYDKRVDAGMAELDAYRDVLKNIDRIREMLESLPETDEEAERAAHEIGRKNLERILGRISACMWLCTVIAYVFGSFVFGGWAHSWLIFLSTTIGQILLSMIKKVNRGKPVGKVIRSGFTGIFWIAVVILYFLLSFGTGAWHLTWLVFLAATVLQIFAGIFTD